MICEKSTTFFDLCAVKTWNVTHYLWCGSRMYDKNYSIHGIKTAKPKRGVFIKDRKKKVVKWPSVCPDTVSLESMDKQKFWGCKASAL